MKEDVYLCAASYHAEEVAKFKIGRLSPLLLLEKLASPSNPRMFLNVRRK